MNVAPVASTPTPARAADAPSPAAAAFGDLLAATPAAGGAPAGSGDQAALMPAATAVPATSANEPEPTLPAAIKAPVADHLPMLPAPRGDGPVTQPAAPLAPANPGQPASATATATQAVGIPAATAPATPAPTPAVTAEVIATHALPWQSVAADNPLAPTPPGTGDDDAHEAVGAGKPKSAKADPARAASSGTQQPQSVVLTATPAATTIQQPGLAPRQDGESTMVVATPTGGAATQTAAQSTPRDTVASAPAAAPATATATATAGTDNLPPLLASQTPGAAIAPPAGQAPAYTPVPAPQAAPVVVAEPGRMGRDIGVEIARHVAAGRDEMMIRLTPAEMGRIDVRLSFDDRGALHAAVSADSPQALDMLRRDAGDLGRSLADAGIRTDSSSFSFDSRDSGAGQFAQQQHGHAGSDGRPRLPGVPLRAADGSETSPIPYRQLCAGGRVDLMA